MSPQEMIEALTFWESVQALLPEELLPIPNEAIALLQGLIRKYPHSLTMQVYLADLQLFAESSSQNVAELLDRVLECDPFNVQAHLCYSSLFSLSSRPAESLESSMNAVKVVRSIETLLNLLEQQKEAGQSIDANVLSELKEKLDSAMQRVVRLEIAEED
jgi:hypothetical protein